MLIRILIILFLISILYFLFSSLVALVKNKPDSNKVVKGLSWRIILSLLLFAAIMILFLTGHHTPKLV